MTTYQLTEAPAAMFDVGSTETIVYCAKDFYTKLVESQQVKDYFGIYDSSDDIQRSNDQYPVRYQITVCGITFVSVF